MFVLAEKVLPGGGGVWIARRMDRAAPSSAALPDEFVIARPATRPDGPTVNATPTDPLAPDARAPAG